MEGTGNRLFYVVDWLPPDFGAVGQYGLYFAREYARNGQRVSLIGLSTAGDQTNREVFEGGGALEVERVLAKPAPRSSNIRRLVWAFAANTRLLRALLAKGEIRGAELVFTGSPPFMLWFALLARAICGVRLRYRITDFYPEVILADRTNRSVLLNLLKHLTWWLRRRVNQFEVLGEDQRALLIAGGIAPKRIKLKRDPSPVLITGHESPKQPPDALKGCLVLLYSGNFGVAHDSQTLVDGLRLHRENGGRFGLWLNATGAKADPVEKALKAAQVPIARTLPGVLEDLPSVLASADAHLITLRNEFAGYVLPSKIYACIKSRRPILYVGPTTSDVHLLGRDKAQLYRHVSCGDVEGFARTLDELAVALGTKSEC